jgi:hypothetical protein
MSFFGKFKPGSVSQHNRTILLLESGDSKSDGVHKELHADKVSRQ